MRILVYGTLKSGFGNHRLLSNSKLVCRGYYEIPNHRLIESGLPYLIKSQETEKFFGEIYELDSLETLENLDALEGHPTWYKRTHIPHLNCSVYVLQNASRVERAQESILNYGA